MRHVTFCGFVLALVAAPSALAAAPVVSAFYYPWFATTGQDGTYAHWAQDGHNPPDDIASVYYPALGVYSSDSAPVLDDQMAEIQEAGIDQIAVSWWGRGSPEDQRLPAVIAAAKLRNIAVAIHIEPYTGRTVESVGADIDYLRSLGISVFYIYQAFLSAPADWAPLNDQLHAEGVTTFAQTALVGQAVTGHFTGIYTYDIVTWNGSKFARLCAEAHAHGLLCAPSVGPGYDARRATGDPHVKPRRDGLTYDSMWRCAIAAGADDITITSFNEWQEGTQIEPAAPPARYGTFSYGSYDGAWGLSGAAAETAYLVRTAYWASVFRRARALATRQGSS
jgi:glycoprotein endo-alpha-1,2-mannosidase